MNARLTPFLEIDQEQDAIISLQLVDEQLAKVVNEVYLWKWIIIALHSSLQGFMVLALEGTNGLNTLEDKNAQKWIAYYDKEGPPPDARRLAGFLTLYRRIKSERMNLYVGSHPFVPGKTQDATVKKLNDYRADFSHFAPMSWLIELEGLPHMVIDIIGIIRFLAFECGNIFWGEEPHKERARALCLSIAQQAEALLTIYRGQSLA